MSAPLANSRSTQWFDRALEVLPGGVSSPVRAFRSVGGTPPVIRAGNGAEIVDEDGNRYLDFVGSWGPLILGHAHPDVVAAVDAAVRRGTSFGAPSAVEIELAEHVVACYPGVEQVRFVSSGTEAVMSAVRLARGASGRDVIVKFSGCYHGHVDHLLVAAGSGLATFGTPSSLGVPEPSAAQTRVLPLDDGDALAALFDREGDRIAAAIIEPVPANNGLLLQRPEFLASLREHCKRHGALLIFDEVISGFRLGPGGAAAHYGVQPDLVTFGKVIGGGMPVGAFGGPRATMQHLAPTGGVYQAGTLSGNPVAMTAGLTTLRILQRQKLAGKRWSVWVNTWNSVSEMCSAGRPSRELSCVSVRFSGSRGVRPSHHDRLKPFPRTPRISTAMYFTAFWHAASRWRHRPTRSASCRWLTMPGISTVSPMPLKKFSRAWTCMTGRQE